MREFTDSSGRAWRAWDVRPEAIHPATKAEDYLAECYVIGWIVFETVSGGEKRRLCPFPARWMDASDELLRELLAQAEAVPPHKVRRQSVTQIQPPRSTGEEPDVTDLDVVRSFAYPGGRQWTACVISRPEDGGSPVLRFTAGSRVFDLERWRKDWADQPEDVLVMMLRRAAPRQNTGDRGPDTPQRRWDDQPGASTPPVPAGPDRRRPR